MLLAHNLGNALSILLIAFAIGFVAPAVAQDVVTARIGEVWLEDEASIRPYHQAFVEGLRERGYIQGNNLQLLTRYANGDKSLIPSLVDELLGLRVDVLFVSHAAVDYAKNATSTVPIVCATMNDPVGAGQVASLSRPGGNLTGLSWQSVDTATQRLEFARELRPEMSRMAVLFDSSDRAARQEALIVTTEAKKAKITVASYEVQTLADVEAVFSTMTTDRPHLLYVVDSATTIGMHNQIAALALTIRLPMVSESRVWAEAGGVLSYGAKLTPALKRGAAYVDRILKGTKPQDLPVEQPTEFELVVNLTSAKATGVQIPESIATLADRVIP
jgi:putative ABC transport system substrate-binding protein